MTEEVPGPDTGPAPGTANPAQGGTEPRCEADNPLSGRCPAPATRTVAVGCVHERIVTRRVCDRHAETTLSGGLIVCRACRYGTDPHQCPLVGRELEGTHA